MWYYVRTDINKGIDPPKSNINKERMTCHCCFPNHGFECQDSVCSDYHDLIMLSVNVSDIAIIAVKNADYHSFIHKSKSEAIHSLKSSFPEDRGYI